MYLSLKASRPAVLINSNTSLPRNHTFTHRCLKRNCIVRAQQPSTSTTTPSSRAEEDSSDQQDDQVPPNCARYSVTLGKPLGLVLEERKNGGIIVAEIPDGGNAANSGVIGVGDELIATSGYTRMGKEQVYGDISVRGGEQVVRLAVRGESFDTVMAAIGSVPAAIGVTLEFQRCSEDSAAS